jgi:biopolymer transport protein ExbB/biopolymer transport protein TolQ
MKSALLALALTGGDWVIWALLAASVAAVAAIVDRFQLLRGESAALAALRAPFLDAIAADDFPAAEKVLARHPGASARALGEALAAAPRGAEASAESLAAALSDEKRRLEKRLLWLGTLGNNAPFIGLLGTVIGVIDAFHQLGDAGQNHGAMGNVMTGIAEALVATGVGLFVALPAVVAYNVLQKKISEVETGVLVLGKLAGAFAEARERAGESIPRFADPASDPAATVLSTAAQATEGE